MATVKQIVNLLKKQPLEDVYSKNFAGKKITKEILTLKKESFMKYYAECDDFNQRKIREFTDCIEAKILNENLDYFPSFLEVYIDKLYRSNGLKSYTSGDMPEFILSKELDLNENYNELVSKFETILMNKSWITEKDIKRWNDFQIKRKNLVLIEEYIYSLEEDIRNDINANLFDEENEPNFLVIFNRHINRIKLEIAEIRLFEYSSDKIPRLEKLVEYFSELSKKPLKYWNDIMEDEGEKNQKKITLTLKLNLLHQFGIIEYLRRVWGSNDMLLPVEYLLETLINGKYDTIQPRLSKPEEPKLRNPTSIRDLKRELKKFGMVMDSIKTPKE